MPNYAGCANTDYVNHNWGCYGDPEGEGYNYPVACYDCDGVSMGGNDACCLQNFPTYWFSQFKTSFPSGNVDTPYSATIFSYIQKDGVTMGNRGPSDGYDDTSGCDPVNNPELCWNGDDGTNALNYIQNRIVSNQPITNPYGNPIVAVFEGLPSDKKHCCGIDDPDTGCTSEDTDCNIKGLSPRFNHLGYRPDSPDVISGLYNNQFGGFNYEVFPENKCADNPNNNQWNEGFYCDCDYSDTEGGPFPGSTYGGTCASGYGGNGYAFYGQYGCQIPWNQAPNFNDDETDWTHPSQIQGTNCTDPSGETEGNVPCISPCVKGFDGPPTVFQEVVGGVGIDLPHSARFLGADSVSAYPYPHIPVDGIDESDDLMYEIEVAMSGDSREGFTVKVYDPADKSFYIVGCITINGNNQDYGNPVEPMTLNYITEGDVYGCTDPNSALCNYNCAATIDDGSCLYPDVNCTDQCVQDGYTNQVTYFSDGDGDGKGCEANPYQVCCTDWPNCNANLEEFHHTTGPFGEAGCTPGDTDCNPPVMGGYCSYDGGSNFYDTNCDPDSYYYGDYLCLMTHGFGTTCETDWDTVCNCDADFLDDCNICGGDNQTDQCVVGEGPSPGTGTNLDCNCDCDGDATLNACGICGYWTEDNNWGLPICYEDTDNDGIGGCIGDGYNTNIISGNCDGSCPSGFSLTGGDTSNPCNDPLADPPCTCDPFNQCSGETHFVDECGYCSEIGQQVSPYMGCDGECFGCPTCSQPNATLGFKTDDCNECMQMDCVKPCEDGIQTWICPDSDIFLEFDDEGTCNESDCTQPCVEYCNMGCYDNGGNYEDNIACNGNYMDNNPCSMFDDEGHWPSWVFYSPGLVPANSNWNASCVDCAGVPNGNNLYDATGDENSWNCCESTDRDICNVCLTAHGVIGGYVIEGTNSQAECPSSEGCNGPYYYSGPIRWWPDSDDDDKGYGANYPLIESAGGNQYGYCGRIENDNLIPGSKPLPTAAIDDWIYFCPAGSITTMGAVDGIEPGTDCCDDADCESSPVPSCNELYCIWDPLPDCASNYVDECGDCDGPGGGQCGCDEDPPTQWVMDFDDNGQGYGYFYNNSWFAGISNQLCEVDVTQLPVICENRTNNLWIPGNSLQDSSDINHCTDSESDSYYCKLNYGKCVCEYFINIPDSNPDVNGLPQSIISNDTSQCIYLDFVYPSNQMNEVITQIDDIVFEWSSPDVSNINDSSPFINGDISSLTYDAILTIENSNSNEVWGPITVTVDNSSHPSAIYDVSGDGELETGTYTAKLQWPATCYNDESVSCLGFAIQDFEIVTPVYGCRDDGTLEISSDPLNCCNSSKTNCEWVIDHWELSGEEVEQCLPACNYNPDANADASGEGACFYRQTWFQQDPEDVEQLCCADLHTSSYACGPLSMCDAPAEHCNIYWDPIVPDDWVTHESCNGYETGDACNCSSNIFDDCGVCRYPCCGSSVEDTCEDGTTWNYNGGIVIWQNSENPCEDGEVPGNPDWNTTCTGCTDPNALNYDENNTIPCTGKCFDGSDEEEYVEGYWTEDCNTNSPNAHVCSGRCSDNVLKPCFLEGDCADDEGTCVFGWITEPDLYDNYFNSGGDINGWDNQGPDCCCEYNQGCVDTLSPSFGYGCPNPETGCPNDCSDSGGVPTVNCLFGFGDGVPIVSNVLVVSDGASDMIQIESAQGGDYIPDFMETQVGRYIRIGQEVLEVESVFEYNNSFFMNVKRELFDTIIPVDGHAVGENIYEENSVCNNTCCAHYTVPACLDTDAQNYYCYTDMVYPQNNQALCPDNIPPDSPWISVVSCDFSTDQNICEDNGWVNNGDGTYSDPEGTIVDLSGTSNCCCEFKYDCTDTKVTVANHTDTAYIDDCGWCVGNGTADFDTIIDTRLPDEDQYICGINPDGGANVECTANWANSGCGCWHPENSPGVINPRYYWTDVQQHLGNDLWPDGFGRQMSWFFNSDNDGFGCYLPYEGCSLGLSYSDQVSCEAAGGVWDTMINHTIKWQDNDEEWNSILNEVQVGDIVTVYRNGSEINVPYGKCINEYLQEGIVKDCFDDKGNCRCDDIYFGGSWEEGRVANCSSYIYAFHKKDGVHNWKYCYEAPSSYISPVCGVEQPNWPAWAPHNQETNFNCDYQWLGYEYQDSYPNFHPLYPDVGDPCACTGSSDGEGDEVVVDEGAVVTPGYYDCNGVCMGDGRRDACGMCYSANSEEPVNTGQCINNGEVYDESIEFLEHCCSNAAGTWDDNTGTCNGVQWGDIGNGWEWKVSGSDVDCNGNCQWYTPVGIVAEMVPCLSEPMTDTITGRTHEAYKECTEWSGSTCVGIWNYCTIDSKTNAFIDDCGVCSGGNTGHYPNKNTNHNDGSTWPFPYLISDFESLYASIHESNRHLFNQIDCAGTCTVDDNEYSEWLDWIISKGGFPYFCNGGSDDEASLNGNIKNYITPTLPKIPTLPWNNYPGVDPYRDEPFAGAGVWAGPDNDCSCTCSGEARVRSNLSWMADEDSQLSGNWSTDSQAMKCCGDGTEGTGETGEISASNFCDGNWNATHPRYWDGDGTGSCFYITETNTGQDLVGGMTCGCTGGTTNIVDDYCVGCAIPTGCPTWDPTCSEGATPSDARNLHEPCNSGNIYINGGFCRTITSESACNDTDDECQWSDLFEECYPKDLVEYEGDWVGGNCLIDDGSCDYCECGFDIPWDPQGQYEINVLLPIMCGATSECPEGKFCTGCKCQGVEIPTAVGECTEARNFYSNCDAFRYINSYDVGCGDAYLYGGNAQNWTNMCWYVPQPKNTYGCAMPYAFTGNHGPSANGQWTWDSNHNNPGWGDSYTPRSYGTYFNNVGGDGMFWHNFNRTSKSYEGPCAETFEDWGSYGYCDYHAGLLWCGDYGGHWQYDSCTSGPGLVNASMNFGLSWTMGAGYFCWGSKGYPNPQSPPNYCQGEYYSSYGWIGTGNCQHSSDRRSQNSHKEFYHGQESWAAWLYNPPARPNCDGPSCDCNEYAGTCQENISCSCTDDSMGTCDATMGCHQTDDGGYLKGSPHAVDYRMTAHKITGGILQNYYTCAQPCGWDDEWHASYVGGHYPQVGAAHVHTSGGRGCYPYERQATINTGNPPSSWGGCTGNGSCTGGQTWSLWKHPNGELTSNAKIWNVGGQTTATTRCGRDHKSNCTAGYSTAVYKDVCEDGHANIDSYYSGNGYFYMGVPTSNTTMWKPNVEGSYAFGKHGLQGNLYNHSSSTSTDLSTNDIWNKQIVMGGMTAQAWVPSMPSDCPYSTDVMIDHDGLFIEGTFAVAGDIYGNYHSCGRGWWCSTPTTSALTGIEYKSCPEENGDQESNKPWPWNDCLAWRCYINHNGSETAVRDCVYAGMMSGEWPEITGDLNAEFGNVGGEYEEVEPEPEDVYGCTDAGACNYDEDATINDASCEYQSCIPIQGRYVKFYDNSHSCYRSECWNNNSYHSPGNYYADFNPQDGVYTSNCTYCDHLNLDGTDCNDDPGTCTDVYKTTPDQCCAHIYGNTYGHAQRCCGGFAADSNDFGDANPYCNDHHCSDGANGYCSYTNGFYPDTGDFYCGTYEELPQNQGTGGVVNPCLAEHPYGAGTLISCGDANSVAGIWSGNFCLDCCMCTNWSIETGWCDDEDVAWIANSVCQQMCLDQGFATNGLGQCICGACPAMGGDNGVGGDIFDPGNTSDSDGGLCGVGVYDDWVQDRQCNQASMVDNSTPGFYDWHNGVTRTQEQCKEDCISVGGNCAQFETWSGSCGCSYQPEVEHTPGDHPEIYAMCLSCQEISECPEKGFKCCDGLSNYDYAMCSWCPNAYSYQTVDGWNAGNYHSCPNTVHNLIVNYQAEMGGPDGLSGAGLGIGYYGCNDENWYSTADDGNLEHISPSWNDNFLKLIMTEQCVNSCCNCYDINTDTGSHEYQSCRDSCRDNKGIHAGYNSCSPDDMMGYPTCAVDWSGDFGPPPPGPINPNESPK